MINLSHELIARIALETLDFMENDYMSEEETMNFLDTTLRKNSSLRPLLNKLYNTINLGTGHLEDDEKLDMLSKEENQAVAEISATCAILAMSMMLSKYVDKTGDSDIDDWLREQLPDNDI